MRRVRRIRRRADFCTSSANSSAWRSVRPPPFLLLQKQERPGAGKPPHLLQPLDRHQRGQRLALPFNDELVVPQGHPIQHVADSLPVIDRRDHGQFPSTFLHKAAGNFAAASIQM